MCNIQCFHCRGLFKLPKKCINNNISKSTTKRVLNIIHIYLGTGIKDISRYLHTNRSPIRKRNVYKKNQWTMIIIILVEYTIYN